VVDLDPPFPLSLPVEPVTGQTDLVILGMVDEPEDELARRRGRRPQPQ
jgi:hypothetical protein